MVWGMFGASSQDGRGSPGLRIHPPDVIGKYAPDSVIGSVGSGVAVAAAPKAAGAPARRGSQLGMVILLFLSEVEI